MSKLNLLGQTYNRLTVIAPALKRGTHNYWQCRCQCGTVIEVEVANLRGNRSKSCGCLRDELAAVAAVTKFTKHGDHSKRIYSTFKNMHQRCYLPSHTAYPNYGAKGITVSHEWAIYEDFREWAYKTGYTDALTLDRKDGEKGYYPDNCRWATYETQTRNRRKQSKATSSQFIGVSREIGSQKWLSSVCVAKKTHRIGFFTDEYLAAKARDQYIIDQGLKHFKMNF